MLLEIDSNLLNTFTTSFTILTLVFGYFVYSIVTRIIDHNHRTARIQQLRSIFAENRFMITDVVSGLFNFVEDIKRKFFLAAMYSSFCKSVMSLFNNYFNNKKECPVQVPIPVMKNKATFRLPQVDKLLSDCVARDEYHDTIFEEYKPKNKQPNDLHWLKRGAFLDEAFGVPNFAVQPNNLGGLKRGAFLDEAFGVSPDNDFKNKDECYDMMFEGYNQKNKQQYPFMVQPENSNIFQFKPVETNNNFCDMVFEADKNGFSFTPINENKNFIPTVVKPEKFNIKPVNKKHPLMRNNKHSRFGVATKKANKFSDLLKKKKVCSPQNKIKDFGSVTCPQNKYAEIIKKFCSYLLENPQHALVMLTIFKPYITQLFEIIKKTTYGKILLDYSLNYIGSDSISNYLLSMYNETNVKTEEAPESPDNDVKTEEAPEDNLTEVKTHTSFVMCSEQIFKFAENFDDSNVTPYSISELTTIGEAQIHITTLLSELNIDGLDINIETLDVSTYTAPNQKVADLVRLIYFVHLGKELYLEQYAKYLKN